jgi:hypothetical protein
MPQPLCAASVPSQTHPRAIVGGRSSPFSIIVASAGIGVAHLAGPVDMAIELLFPVANGPSCPENDRNGGSSYPRRAD